MDRGVWWVIVHGIAKNGTQLSNQAHHTVFPCTIYTTVYFSILLLCSFGLFLFFGNPFPLCTELQFSGYILVFFLITSLPVKFVSKKREKHFKA